MYSFKKSKLCIIISLLIFCVWGFGNIFTLEIQAAANCTHYIDGHSGNDSNSGTSLNQAWKSFGKANSSLNPGNTVCIKGGTYNDFIEPNNNGSNGQEITYINYQNEKVALAGKSGVEKLVALRGKKYIVVDGLTINYQHGKAGGSGRVRWQWVALSNDAEHNIIRNNHIFRGPVDNDKVPPNHDDMQGLWDAQYREFGIAIYGGKYNLVENNTIQGVNMGFRFSDSPRGNIIRNNHISYIPQSCFVISTDYGIQGTLIEGNLCEYTWSEDGVQTMPQPTSSSTNTSTQGVIIRNNIFRYNNENAIDLKGTANIVIEGNVIYGTVGSNCGARCGDSTCLDGDGDKGDFGAGYGCWNRTSFGTITRGARNTTKDIIIRRNIIFDSAPAIRTHDGFKIYNNTMVANNRDYKGYNSNWTTSSRPGFYAIRQQSDSSKMSIVNNISVGHNGAEFALYPTGNSNYFDYNLFYNSQGVYFADVSGTSWKKHTFSEWKNIINDEQHSLSEQNPQFINAPERPNLAQTDDDQLQTKADLDKFFDFHLKPGSPAIDAGGHLTTTTNSGPGTTLKVQDAGFFMDGFDVTDGDQIMIGNSKIAVEIDQVNYDSNELKLVNSASWSSGDKVYLTYNGNAPDIGAFEYEGAQQVKCFSTVDTIVNQNDVWTWIKQYIMRHPLFELFSDNLINSLEFGYLIKNWGMDCE